MTSKILLALCELLMCSDPYPGEDSDRDTIVDYLNKESLRLGYIDWIDALHRIKKES